MFECMKLTTVLFGSRRDYSGIERRVCMWWWRHRLDVRITETLHQNNETHFAGRAGQLHQLCVVNTIGIFSGEIYVQSAPEKCSLRPALAAWSGSIKFQSILAESIWDECSWFVIFFNQRLCSRCCGFWILFYFVLYFSRPNRLYVVIYFLGLKINEYNRQKNE